MRADLAPANMMTELDFLEIDFSNVIPEPKLLSQVSRLLGIAPAAMWNWHWPGQPPEGVLVNVNYLVHEDASYPLFLTLSFNQTQEVALGFGIELGFSLAQWFGCIALINDPSDPHGQPDRLLEIRPDGQVISCTCDEDAAGQRQYRPITWGLSGSYQQAVRTLEDRARPVPPQPSASPETLVGDFYAGFEGEPEIKFVRTGKAVNALIAWEGYFTHIMEAIEPGPDGIWQGLALQYHLHTGWYAHERFSVEDPALFAEQLSTLSIVDMEPATVRFHDALCSFIHEAIRQNDALYLQYS